MARVFPEDSPWLDKENVPESLEKIERYLRYMQERIEHKNYSDDIYNQRQNEELALIVKRTGTQVEINDSAIQTAAGVDGLDTRITQNATSITSVANRVTTVEGDITTMSSSVTQTANSISSIVQAVGSNGTVTAASIVQAVNNAGSSVKISADHITLSGDVVMKSNLTDGSTQISGSNITTGTINADRIGAGTISANKLVLNDIALSGSQITSAVANATNAAQAAQATAAETANYLNTALSGFASTMRGYINTALQAATSSANAMSIAGVPVYEDTYLNKTTIKFDFGSNYHLRICPTGITLGNYRYYLILNTPAGEFGIRTYGTSAGSTISIGYTD